MKNGIANAMNMPYDRLVCDGRYLIFERFREAIIYKKESHAPNLRLFKEFRKIPVLKHFYDFLNFKVLFVILRVKGTTAYNTESNITDLLQH